MKANIKYTAGEIVAAAFPKLKIEDIFGKTRVRIGGIPGIVKSSHVVYIAPGTKELEVIVGNEVSSLKIEGDSKEVFHSETAKAVNEAEGKVESQRQTELKKKDEKK